MFSQIQKQGNDKIQKFYVLTNTVAIVSKKNCLMLFRAVDQPFLIVHRQNIIQKINKFYFKILDCHQKQIPSKYFIENGM